MKENKFRFIWVILVLTALLVSGCNNGANPNQADNSENTESKGKIVVGLNNWAENIAVSNLWKVILEEKDYEVDLMALDKSPVWTGISKGELDLSPEVWLPNTDAPLYDKYKDDLEIHEQWYEGTGLGLVVPTYMDINSIDELNAKKDELGLKSIVGIDPGSSLMGMTRNAVEEYGLDYELIESSDAGMMSELMASYRKEEPVVVTLWSPHWAFSEYDLKYLEDPKKVYGEKDNIVYMTRKGFTKDYPEIVKWMDNWEMDDQSLGSLMATINEVGDPEDGATKWIEENRQLVDEWLK